jgi:hypothetical protein
VLDGGKAIAPSDVPPPAYRETLAKVVDAAHAITGLPYRYGGGHRPYPPAEAGHPTAAGHLPDGQLDTGYDGSGVVSYALHAGGFLDEPRSAEQLRDPEQLSPGRWIMGPGRWITAVLCSDGAHMIIGGARFDGHQVNDDQPPGPRWRPRSRGLDGCTTGHPQNY